MTVASDIQSLAPGEIVELFELDLNPIGTAEVYRFHAGVNELNSDVVWDGNTYTRFPVKADGFAKSGQGALPRPKIGIANVTGLIGALAREAGDLIGAKLTRIRTFVKYLDAVNFADGNPTADPNQYLDREVWFIDRKSVEGKIFVEFELATAYDVVGVMLPGRQAIQTVCQWLAKGGYRGPYCSYAGGPVADKNDDPVTTLAEDKCAGRLSSCKLRFGAFNPLPFGSFPGSGLTRG